MIESWWWWWWWWRIKWTIMHLCLDKALCDFCSWLFVNYCSIVCFVHAFVYALSHFLHWIVVNSATQDIIGWYLYTTDTSLTYTHCFKCHCITFNCPTAWHSMFLIQWDWHCIVLISQSENRILQLKAVKLTMISNGFILIYWYNVY